MRPARCAFLTAALLLPQGCATAAVYGPVSADQAFGYSERKREGGSYILRVVDPSAEQAMTFWDRRAAELCGSSTYVKNIYEAVRPTLRYSNYGGTPGVAVLEGILTCAEPQAAPAAP